MCQNVIVFLAIHTKDGMQNDNIYELYTTKNDLSMKSACDVDS